MGFPIVASITRRNLIYFQSDPMMAPVPSLITIVESPTCKKDVVNAESTDNIMAIVSKIIETYHELGLHTPVGPLVPINPDGTSHFRKASGQKLSLDLPTQVGAKFVSVFGELCCPFFNCVGGC